MKKTLAGIYIGDMRDSLRYVRQAMGLHRGFDPSFFDEKYEVLDPFHYEGSGYDEMKRATVRFGLSERRYRHVLDVGSGEGYLAAHVRGSAERISLLDCSPVAVSRARERVQLPGDDLVGDSYEVLSRLPVAYCDCIIVSEMLYYVAPFPFSARGMRLRNELVRVLEPGGRLVMLHPYGSWFHLPARLSSDLKLVERVRLNAFRSVEMVAFERR